MTYDSRGANSQTRIAVMQLLFLHLFFRHPLSPGFRSSMAILLASRNPIHAHGEARLPVTVSTSSLRQVACLSQQCRFRWRHCIGAISDTFKSFCIFNRLSTLVLLKWCFGAKKWLQFPVVVNFCWLRYCLNKASSSDHGSHDFKM